MTVRSPVLAGVPGLPRAVMGTSIALLIGLLAGAFGLLGAVLVPVGLIAAYVTVARPGILLAAYVLIPFYKGAVEPYLPVDLTVVLAVLNALQLVFLVRTRPVIRVNPVAFWVWTAIAAMVLVGLTYAPDQGIALEHTATWWALVFVPLFAGFRVAADPRAVRDFLVGLFTLGVVVVLIGLPEVSSGDRIAVLGTNTIGVGRAALLVPLIGLTFVMHAASRPVRLVTLMLIPAAIVVELGSGSRGPLLALLVVGALVQMQRLAAGRFPSRQRLVAALAALGIVGGIGLAVLPDLPEPATYRFGLLTDFVGSALAGDLNVVGDTSAGTRVTLFRLATEMFAERPFLGYGTASYQSFALERLSAIEYASYPHNTILQFAAEFGVLGLVLSTTLWGLALFRPLPRVPMWTAVRLTFVFFLINAFVSGDIYGDRMLWALGMLLAAAPARDPDLPMDSADLRR